MTTAETRSSVLRKGQDAAEDFIRHGVETWESEGHIDRTRAEALIGTLDVPEVETGMLHLGAHFAISLPLRYPFGAAARFFYTLGLRLRAEINALIRRSSAREARRMHTLTVMLVSLLPGFGRLGYFFSPALRDERLLLFIPLDQASRKLPFRAYRRLHLDALFLYWGLGDEQEQRRPRLSLRSVGDSFASLKPYLWPIAALLTFDIAVLLAGAYMYVDEGRPEQPLWWWRERGLVAMVDASQLLIAAALGIATFVAFWKYRPHATRSEAAGIFLWGIGGIGLALFAVDDFFTIHERLGDAVFDTLGLLPVVTHLASDMLVVTYAVIGLAVIVTFRMEVLSGRPSAMLLQLAAFASIVMVLADGFATADVLRAFEFPAQTFACLLLVLAFAMRYLEVRQTMPSRTGLELCEAGR